MKVARTIPILSGAAAAALVVMTAPPTLAGPVGPAQPRMGHPASARHAVRSILQTGTAVTGVRGSGGRGVVLTGTYVADHRLVSANAFVYNISTRRYTLLRLHGSLSTKSSFYGIWQDGGPGSPRYTLAGGSSAHGGQRGFLINYNERTGRFGRPYFFTYFNRPVTTHFEGITAVSGGSNLVGMAPGHAPGLAHIRVLRHGGFSRARWRPVPVSSSALCPCKIITGNTVWRNRVMGLYVNTANPADRTYLAVIANR